MELAEAEQELAEHGTTMVKLLNKGSAQHAGRARMIALKGDQAVVQPFGHKHTEVVSLDKVKLWKGGNHHRQLFKNQTNKGPDPYLIYLPKQKLFWGGGMRGFEPSIGRAVFYEEEQFSRRAITKMLRNQKLRDQVGDDTLTICRRSQVPAWLAPKVQAPVKPEPQVLRLLPEQMPATPAPVVEPVKQVVESKIIPIAPIVIGPGTPVTFTKVCKPADVVFESWAKAIRDQAEADALKLDAQRNLVLAEAELAIIAKGKELGLE